MNEITRKAWLALPRKMQNKAKHAKKVERRRKERAIAKEKNK